MKKKTSKTVWSTIKFPRDFVADISAYSKETGWRSSCEFVMAAVDFIQKHDLDLHGELPVSCQTDVSFLTKAMGVVANMLSGFPEKADLVEQASKLNADLSSVRQELLKANKAVLSWKGACDDLKAERRHALDEVDGLKREVSRLTGVTKGQGERLLSISAMVNDTLRQMEGSSSFLGGMGMSGRKFSIALEALKKIASETSIPP